MRLPAGRLSSSRTHGRRCSSDAVSPRPAPVFARRAFVYHRRAYRVLRGISKDAILSKTQQGVVNIRGKEYQTVALRVHNFRTEYKDHQLITEIIHRDADCVVMLATIFGPDGKILATGHAEEYRKTSEINRTSALENAETSAIGRALACFGLGGTEFASADEVARAVSGEKGAAIDRTRVMKCRANIQEHLAEGREVGALQEWDEARESGEEFALAVWSGLTTPEREQLRALARATKD